MHYKIPIYLLNVLYNSWKQFYLVLANLLWLSNVWEGVTSSHLNSLGSIQWCCLTWHIQPLKPFTIMTSFSLIPETLEALWLGMNPMVHRWSLMCTNHIEMAAHTPVFFTKSGTTHLYVECSTAGPSHVSHYGAMLVGPSPIHVLTRCMVA